MLEYQKIDYLTNEELEKLTPHFFFYKEIDISNKKVFVIGDLHQDKISLFAILKATKFFEQEVILFFLGDYIDRGKNIFMVNILLTLKKEYPNRIYLLKGNHEIVENNISIPQQDETSFFYRLEQFSKIDKFKDKITPKLIKTYKNIFVSLPYCIILKQGNIKLLLTHGLIPRINLDTGYIDNFEDIFYKTSPIAKAYIQDFLWNDIGKKHYSSKTRYEVSQDEILAFLEKYNFDYIIRAHQNFKEGFKVNDRVITIFSNGGIDYKNNKNQNSHYQNITPTILDLTNEKIEYFSFDGNLKLAFKLHFTKLKNPFYQFPKKSPSTIKSFKFGNFKIRDLYTGCVYILNDKKIVGYKELVNFYGIDKNFKVEIKDKKVKNLSPYKIFINGIECLPNQEREVIYSFIIKIPQRGEIEFFNEEIENILIENKNTIFHKIKKNQNSVIYFNGVKLEEKEFNIIFLKRKLSGVIEIDNHRYYTKDYNERVSSD